MSIPRGRIPKHSNRGFIAWLLALFLLGGGVIGYIVLKPKTVTPVIIDTSAPLPPAKGYVMGRESAPVEIVIFGDFECPGCGEFATLTEPDVRKRLIETGQARFRFMDFPLPSIHPATLFAHNAAACAGVQNKFWEMHDSIYAGQAEWSQIRNHRDMNPPRIFKRYAKSLGLDTKAFDTCLDSRQMEPQIRANQQNGVALKIPATPTIIIGKRMLVGSQPYDAIKSVVDSTIAEAKHAPPVAKPTPIPGEAGKKSK